ncbi:MAG: histidine kinase dimerization/phospho-acceptor domain-containing protein [Acidocella sp.]|nr:histidine kinase dimerization/phospho-acceptor domain-containing protein [Acidocella sp.]
MTNAPSLRRTALVWITALLAIMGFITASAAYVYSESETAVFLDSQLRQIALNAGPGLAVANAPAAPDEDPEDSFAVTIWDASGHDVHQSLPSAQIPLQPSSGFAVVRASGEAWRVYTLRGSNRSVQVAQRITVRDEIASNAAMGATLPVLLLIPLSWLVVGLALHRTLRRLDHLANDLATRGTQATDPLPLSAVPAELKPLVTAMNGLIFRLNAALAAQKRFLADAAHTLRTPLTAMLIEIENLRADKPSANQRLRLEALAAGGRRAAALVHQLLQLAQLDELALPRRARFDAAALLLDCVADQTPLASRKEIDLGASVTQPAMIFGVAEEIRTLFANLIENALTYTQAGGVVDITLCPTDGGFLAEILDTGPGLPAGVEEFLFERFYRAAPQAAEGSGLGLAIARRIADRHGFGLEVTNRADDVNGVQARVTIPTPLT